MAFGNFGDGPRWNIKQEKILSRKETSAILSLAKKTRFEDYVFLAVAANTGLRLCEIIHLKVGDVRKGVLTVVRRKKKKLSQEPMPITDGLNKLLAQMSSTLRSSDSNSWLWPGVSRTCTTRSLTPCGGFHLSKREMQRRWMEYLRKLNLYQQGRGVHSLRHYAVTEFYREHKDLRAAQQFAGHSSSTITETYAHVLDMEEKVNKVRPTL